MIKCKQEQNRCELHVIHSFYLLSINKLYYIKHRILLRVIIPFRILLLEGLFTKKDNEEVLYRFYVKMQINVLAHQ